MEEALTWRSQWGPTIPKPAGWHEERLCVIPKSYSSKITSVEEADIQHVIDSHAAEITEDDIEEPWGLNEAEDMKDSDTVVDRLQLIIRVLTEKPPGGG